MRWGEIIILNHSSTWEKTLDNAIGQRLNAEVIRPSKEKNEPHSLSQLQSLRAHRFLVSSFFCCVVHRRRSQFTAMICCPHLLYNQCLYQLGISRLLRGRDPPASRSMLRSLHFTCLSLSLLVCLSMSLSVPFWVSVCLSVCLCVSLSLSPPLSVSLSVSHRVSLYVSLCIYLCYSFSLVDPIYLTLSRSVSFHVYFYVELFVTFDLFLTVSLPHFRSLLDRLSIFLSLFMFVSLSLSLCVYISISLSLH